MSKKFHWKKHKILDALSIPSNDYTDASPKGSVDDGVRDLIKQINDNPGFVTTSSCAGRVAVYLEGPPKPAQAISYSGDQDDAASISPESSIVSSAGGKGGGRWLFSSHVPIDLSSLRSPGMLYRLFGFSSQAEISFPSADTRPQFIHFKFEPMILHILASSAEDAQTALQAATQSGFRESGISGLLDNKGRPSTPMVAVRTSGLALDSIIGFRNPKTGTTVPMVPETYLRAIVKLSNERFSINEERKERFSSTFYLKGQEAHVSEISKAAKEARRREEGLARRREMLLAGGALDGTPRESDGQRAEGEEGYGLDLLLVREDGTEGHQNEVGGES